MNTKLLTRIKIKLKEIFTKLIRIIQKFVKKLPDGEGKVKFLQLLKKAKEKLNKVNSIKNQEMADELKRDADDIEEAIKNASKKYDEKYFKTIDKIKLEDDNETPKDTISNNRLLKKSDKLEVKSRNFDKKYKANESLSIFDLLYSY